MTTTTAPSTAPALRRDRHHRGAGRWFITGLIVIGAAAVLLPMAIMVLNAFKSPADYANNGPLSLPTGFSTDGLVAYWNRVDYPVKLWNSFLISSITAVCAVILSLLNSYAVGVGRLRGSMWIVAAFLLANMLPQEALVYPLYYVARETGLYDTQLIVIIITTAVHTAFGTYLLSSVLGTFPPALLEAAALDGASRWRILWRIVYPVVRPTLSVLLIFFFIWTWNDFFFPLIMLISNDTQTVPVALASLQGDKLMDATTTNAGALISLIPAVIFFLIFQRTLTRGIAAGAVK